MQLKKLRVIERILWTDQHGYGKSDKAIKTASSPKNKKPRAKKQSKDQDAHSPKSKKPRAKKQSKDQDAHKDGQDSSNNSDYASEELDMDTFEDDIISGCNCGANGKAMNPRNYHREKNPMLPTRPYNKRLNLSRTFGFGDAHARINYDDVPDEHNVVTPDGDAHTKINDSDVECYDGVPDEHNVVTPDGDDSECYDGLPDEHDVVTPDGDDSDVECYDGVPDKHDVVAPDGDAHTKINDSDVECYDGVPDEHNFVTSDGDAHVPMTDVDSDHEIPDEHVSECNCNTLTTAHKHISEPHINDRTNAAQPEPQINDRTNATQPHINEPCEHRLWFSCR